jgi:hypothetical protein
MDWQNVILDTSANTVFPSGAGTEVLIGLKGFSFNFFNSIKVS